MKGKYCGFDLSCFDSKVFNEIVNEEELQEIVTNLESCDPAKSTIRIYTRLKSKGHNYPLTLSYIGDTHNIADFEHLLWRLRSSLASLERKLKHRSRLPR